MLLTIKCDTLELVGAQSKDKEISCELPNCIEGYLISKAGKKIPSRGEMEIHRLSSGFILGGSLQSFKEMKLFFYLFFHECVY